MNSGADFLLGGVVDGGGGGLPMGMAAFGPD